MSVTSAILKLRRFHNGPRRLPSSANDGGDVVIAGLGTFAFVSVGSTAYTTGIDVLFQPEGEEEAANGHLQFHSTITDDLQIKWVLTEHSLDYGDYAGERFGARVWETANILVDELHIRAPSSWGFHVSDAAHMETTKHKRHLSDMATQSPT